MFNLLPFHIPSGSESIVAVGLGKWKKGSSSHYGYIQSRLLFQWFQKYSHRWLETGEREEEEFGDAVCQGKNLETP